MAENNKKDSFNFPPVGGKNNKGAVAGISMRMRHCRFHYRDSIFQYAFESGTDLVAEV